MPNRLLWRMAHRKARMCLSPNIIDDQLVKYAEPAFVKNGTSESKDVPDPKHRGKIKFPFSKT